MNAKKTLMIIVGIVLLGSIVAFSVKHSQANVVTVTTAKVSREDLTSVISGSGEIKPKNYVNIGANAFGKITKLYVKEGDRVKHGQTLAQLENVQPSSDLEAQKASVDSSSTDAVAAEAAEKTAEANVNKAEADLEQKQLDYQRAHELYAQQLIAKSDFDAKKAAYDVAVASVNETKATLAQNHAQIASAHGHVTQARAAMRRYSDALDKTIYTAPFDGVITNVPVREGETVVIGIQNSPGSTLMTISDLSIITAEVRIDETDIVNVRLQQPAEVTIDAIPGQTFKAHVTEIGDNAILRSSGVSTSQSTSSGQEAKDFKVVVTLDNPPENLRPGLSATAKITTASKQNTLAIPIQALTIRRKSDLEQNANGRSVPVSTPVPGKLNPEMEGVFIVHGEGRNRTAVFAPIHTGISGNTEIEVMDGIKEGDEIVTGSYKALTHLRNGAGIKVDNAPPKKEDEDNS